MPLKPKITGKTILIADDEPVNIKILNKILASKGHNTIAAADGAACVQMAEQYRPDLILLDIMMPRMDGIEACRILKNGRTTRNIPIIFVTSDTSSAALQKAFESGGTDYVRKPVNVTELLARVESVLLQQELIREHIKDEKLKGTLEMAGAICHELNQPLQYISGAAQLLLMDLAKNSREYQQVLKIKENVDRMATTTRKLMGITTVESRAYAGGTRIVDIEKSS